MARVLLTGGAGFIGSQTAVDLIGRALRRVMRHHDVRRLIFSSSGSIYGEVADVPIPESRPHRPSNPYSATKSIIEASYLRFPDFRFLPLLGSGRMSPSYKPVPMRTAAASMKITHEPQATPITPAKMSDPVT